MTWRSYPAVKFQPYTAETVEKYLNQANHPHNGIMKLSSIQIVKFAQNAVKETLARAERHFANFAAQRIGRSVKDSTIHKQMNQILEKNGSASLTFKIDDKIIRENLRSERRATRKQDTAKTRYQQSIDHLAMFVDTEKYPIVEKDLARILYPAISTLPTEADKSEKLSRSGRMFLEIQCQAYMMQLPSRNKTEKLDSFDYSRFRDGSCDALYQPELLNQFLRENGIYDSIILDYSAHESTRQEQAVFALYQLVGTLVTSYGPQRASEFINARVIGGSNGLMRFHIEK